MSCHICSRASSSRLRYLCPTCARSELYQLRIESARVLLEKEFLGQQIDKAISSKTALEAPSDEPETENASLENDDHRVWVIQTINNELAKSSARTKTLASQIENIQLEIRDKQRNISQRRLTLARRRSDTGSAQYQLTDREAAILSGIQNNIKRTDHLWHSLHSKTAEARIFLCREAANLYGLRQKVKRKDVITLQPNFITNSGFAILLTPTSTTLH
ncbi:hypothetical protein BBP40_010688 [Aspergillus hancockii]|nr:hypothetical protein BBP40_010688 [Aspergillus hancockii]